MNHRFLFAAFILTTLASFSLSASVDGIVWDSEKGGPVEGAAVEINTIPEQRDVTGPEGTYSFNLGPGTYTLLVKRVNREHELELVARQNITIEKEGEYVLDILLVPPDTQISDLDNDPEFQMPGDPAEEPKPQGTMLLFFGAAALILIAVFAYLVFERDRRHKKREEELGGLASVKAPEHPEKPTVKWAPPPHREISMEMKKANRHLPEDLREVVRVLKENGGRMTQKDLRKNFPLSEAKVSLMLTDLENRGMVRRIKQGRGNAIILEEFE